MSKRNDELPQRELTTRAGNVTLRREQWQCTKCRILFFPLDQKLRLGTEGYSPRLLEKVVRQAAKAASFKEASEDLQALAEVSISATHVQRLSPGAQGQAACQKRPRVIRRRPLTGRSKSEPC